MNSIPILTVNDLATDSFKIDKRGIDLKLSSVTANGLKLTPQGLTYSADNKSSNHRALLGVLSGNVTNTYNFNNEVQLILSSEDLGSDGTYLYFGLNSDHEVMLSRYSGQDSTTVGGEVSYGNSFENIPWMDVSEQFNITYVIDGVTRTLMVSYVKLGDAFFVWCDTVCVEPINFIDLNPTLPEGGIIFNGVRYSEFQIVTTFGLNAVWIAAMNSETNGFDQFLTSIATVGTGNPNFSFMGIDDSKPIRPKYNYATKKIAIIHNRGSILKIIDKDNLISVEIETDMVDDNCTFDIYKDPNSLDSIVAVIFRDNNLLVRYRFNAEENTLSVESSYSVNFDSYHQNTEQYQIVALKIISDTHFGIASVITAVGGDYLYKLMVINAIETALVVEHDINGVNDSCGVENLNWIMDIDDANQKVRYYELTETAINQILEHTLTERSFASMSKSVNPFAVETVEDGFPGLVFTHWSSKLYEILTPYLDNGVPKLHVQKATSANLLEDETSYLGFGEVVITPNGAMIAAIDRTYNPVALELTLVN